MTWYKIQLWLAPLVTALTDYFLLLALSAGAFAAGDANFLLLESLELLLLLSLVTLVVAAFLHLWKPAPARFIHLIGVVALIVPSLYDTYTLGGIFLPTLDMFSVLLLIVFGAPLLFTWIAWREWRRCRAPEPLPRTTPPIG